MNKALLFFTLFLTFSKLAATNVVIQTKDNLLIEGEFVGTYFKYVHVLRGVNLEHFNCNEIESILIRDTKKPLVYNCSENSVSEEILFPPELDPMTGEWITIMPDIFNKTKPENKNKKIKEIKNSLPILKSKVNKKQLDSNKKQILKEEAVYLTKSEIQTLIREELKKHTLKQNKEKRKKRKDRGLSLYERYENGVITESEFNKIVNGRSPVELLEANLITQKEYNRNPRMSKNPFDYIGKYGLTTTMTRKPEFLLLPAFGIYVFLLIVFN